MPDRETLLRAARQDPIAATTLAVADATLGVADQVARLIETLENVAEQEAADNAKLRDAIHDATHDIDIALRELRR